MVGNEGKTLKLIHPIVFPMKKGDVLKFIGGDVTYLSPTQLKGLNLVKAEYKERLVLNYGA